MEMKVLQHTEAFKTKNIHCNTVFWSQAWLKAFVTGLECVTHSKDTASEYAGLGKTLFTHALLSPEANRTEGSI